jgi:hypothetical protein
MYSVVGILVLVVLVLLNSCTSSLQYLLHLELRPLLLETGKCKLEATSVKTSPLSKKRRKRGLINV